MAAGNTKDKKGADFVEEVQIAGHIIDSLILPKILDLITASGGSFRITKISIGQARTDASSALVEVHADSAVQLAEILAKIKDHGAVKTTQQDCDTAPADIAGALPEGFYATTDQRTQVRIAGKWVEVANQEMDCGIEIDAEAQSARCVPMNEAALGDKFVVGHAGVRVFPQERSVERSDFEFMGSSVSTEKPKSAIIRQIASELFRNRAAGGKTLFVGGPAIVHTGSGENLCKLIRGGYVNTLFGGNALAAHDIEQAIFGTSLGVHLERGDLAEHGHEHYLRAINKVRRAGSILKAVETGILKSGIMFECIRSKVNFVLAGSIRDDGPLPEVITDTMAAQKRMRRELEGVTFCLMVASTLHSIAVSNLLPGSVKVVCVDINPSTVVMINDRNLFQTVGLVTDVEPFLRALAAELEVLERAA